jgi:hypothetical protein
MNTNTPKLIPASLPLHCPLLGVVVVVVEDEELDIGFDILGLCDFFSFGLEKLVTKTFENFQRALARELSITQETKV